MHDELTIYEIERVALVDFIAALENAIAQRCIKLRHVIFSGPSVGRVRNAEGEGEIKALDELIAAVMTLDHTEVVDRLVTNGEGHAVKEEQYIMREGLS